MQTIVYVEQYDERKMHGDRYIHGKQKIMMIIICLLMQQ